MITSAWTMSLRTGLSIPVSHPIPRQDSVLYNQTLTATAEASRDFRNLVQELARVGLAIEVRNGENCSLLVFVKVASDERLNNAVYRFRCALRLQVS